MEVIKLLSRTDEKELEAIRDITSPCKTAVATEESSLVAISYIEMEPAITILNFVFFFLATKEIKAMKIAFYSVVSGC